MSSTSGTDFRAAGVAGDLVTDTASQLTAAAAAVLTGHRVTRLVIDLARVARLDMDALHPAAGTRRCSTGRRPFRVIRPQPSVRQVLHLTDTCQLLSGAP